MALGLKSLIANPACTMKEDRTLERVLRLALVQLAGRAAPFLGLLDPVEREQRALHAPDLAKRERQAVRARVGTEAFQHRGRAGHARADGGRKPEHVRPVGGDQPFVDHARDQRRDVGAGVKTREQVKPPCRQVRDARREQEPDQGAKREHVIGYAAPVGVMPLD